MMTCQRSDFLHGPVNIYQAIDYMSSIRIMLWRRPLGSYELHDLMLAFARHCGIRNNHLDLLDN